MNNNAASMIVYSDILASHINNHSVETHIRIHIHIYRDARGVYLCVSSFAI